MSRPVLYLHVGVPKSGTSTVQATLTQHADDLAADGVLWPGRWWKNQARGVAELRGLKRDEEPAPDGPWRRIADEICAFEGRAVILSMEWLANLSPYQQTVLLRDTGDLPISLVCTARDLVRTAATSWQEITQNRVSVSLADWLDGLLSDDPPMIAARFWKSHRLGQMLNRWERALGDRRAGTHLVTVPPPGSDPALLWERFCDAVPGCDPSWRLDRSVNTSIGVVGAELMRRIDEEAERQQFDRETYARVLKHLVAKQILGRWAPRDAIAVPEEVQQALGRRASIMVEHLSERPDLILHGDLDDLRPRRLVGGRDPATVTDAELLTLGVAVLVDLARGGEVQEATARVDSRDGTPKLAADATLGVTGPEPRPS